jgi:hypothetical protein
VKACSCTYHGSSQSFNGQLETITNLHATRLWWHVEFSRTTNTSPKAGVHLS